MSQGHAVIIGGTRGSGQALAQRLAFNDMKVSVIGRNQPEEKDALIDYWAVDLTDDSAVTTAANHIISENGKINYLVFFQRFRDDGDDWAGEVQTSLTATKHIIDHFTDHFADDDKSIVIISSNASHLVANEQPLSYHVAKAGLNQMVRYYAMMLGEKNIRVNAVTPGSVLKQENEEFYLKNEDLVELYKEITPLERMGTSEDIANGIEFLCSPKASFITGQNLIIDGGLSLHWQESLARKLTQNKNVKVTR